MRKQVLLSIIYDRKKGVLRGAGTSPLATASPKAIAFKSRLLIKRIAKVGDKGKRF